MISMCFTFGTIYMQFRRPGVRAEFLFSFFQIFFSLVRLHLTVGLSASLSNLFNCSVPLPRRSFSAITSLCYSIHLELLKGILDSNFPDHNVISCVFPSWQLFAWDMSLVRHLTELREPILNQLQDLKKRIKISAAHLEIVWLYLSPEYFFHPLEIQVSVCYLANVALSR